jgi:hypothetical protein
MEIQSAYAQTLGKFEIMMPKRSFFAGGVHCSLKLQAVMFGGFHDNRSLDFFYWIFGWVNPKKSIKVLFL